MIRITPILADLDATAGARVELNRRGVLALAEMQAQRDVDATCAEYHSTESRAERLEIERRHARALQALAAIRREINAMERAR